MYKKINKKNLEQNIKLAFIELLHENIMQQIKLLLSESDFKLFEQYIKIKYQAVIIKEINK